jgi:uncharacterized membrane protein (DUF106 family)
MNSLNMLLNRVGAALLAPFEQHPALGLIVWGAVSGVVATYVFGRTSNQRRLAEVADQTRAQLLAIKLFKDDLRVTFRCQVALLKATGMRLAYSLPPMLVMIVPFVLVMIQLAVRYDHEPICPGESTVVEITLAEEAWDKLHNIRLEAPVDVVVETESLRDEFRHTLCWRIRPEKPGKTMLSWKIGGEKLQKEVVVGPESTLVGVSTRRPGADAWDRLLHPTEAAFSAADPVRAIDVEHVMRRTLIFGFDIPWWATFLIASMISALMVRRSLGVTF